MNGKILGLLAMGMLAVPMAANATQVAWQFQGNITLSTGAAVGVGIQVGDPFSFVMHFDTSTPVSNPGPCGLGGPGTLCLHNGDLSMYFSDLSFGGYPPFDLTYDPGDPARILVRNNAADPVLGDPVDGYTFSRNDITAGTTYEELLQVIMRGPEDLGLVTDGRVLPSIPPPGLTGLRTSLFEFCGSSDPANVDTCDVFHLVGDFSAVSAAPEPGSLALLGLGLAGLTGTRRRKQN